MSAAFYRSVLASALAAATALACGSGESARGFGEPVEGYQSPPAGQENASQPPNNLLACSPESGCQSCQSACDLCTCRFEGDQLDENEYALCIASPSCIAAIREFAGVEAGSNNGPDAQFIHGGEQGGQSCLQFVDNDCAYCECVDIGDCDFACDPPPGS